jgi:hypothetical protein
MSDKIIVKKSPTADTRTCDVTKVSIEELKNSTRLHIYDVQRALNFFIDKIEKARANHDFTKNTQMNQFYSDFKTGFKEHSWWDNHRKEERHHIQQPDGIRADVDLVDVMEFIADCVMAGMARSGSVYELKLPDELLQIAFKNTVEKLKNNVEVEK